MTRAVVTARIIAAGLSKAAMLGSKRSTLAGREGAPPQCDVYRALSPRFGLKSKGLGVSLHFLLTIPRLQHNAPVKSSNAVELKAYVVRLAVCASSVVCSPMCDHSDPSIPSFTYPSWKVTVMLV